MVDLTNQIFYINFRFVQDFEIRDFLKCNQLMREHVEAGVIVAFMLIGCFFWKSSNLLRIERQYSPVFSVPQTAPVFMQPPVTSLVNL